MKGLPPIEGRPGEHLPPFNFEDTKKDLIEKFGPRIKDIDVMSYAMYPQVASDFFEFRDTYGPVDKLETRVFLVGPKVGEEFETTIDKGKTLHFKTLAVAADLTKNGLREVFFEFNGQLRSVFIRDKTAAKVYGVKMMVYMRSYSQNNNPWHMTPCRFSGTAYSSKGREKR